MIRYRQTQQKFNSSNNTGLIKIVFFLFIISFIISCSSKINPGKPNLQRTNFKLDSLPESQINIPININLKPLYSFAEKNVDTTFTSNNYPDDWVQERCDTRYKYFFRRSKLQLNAIGNKLQLGFTGFYKITGSTRVCVAGKVITPWTPPCRCGFNEDERRVNVLFTNTLNVTPDYKIKLSIKREEPLPLDKCEVCFWGQDITNIVMKGLKEELDTAKAGIEKKYGVSDIKPKMQMVWNELNKIYSLPGLGFLKLNPQRMQINNLYAEGDSLKIFLGLSAKPVVSFEKPVEIISDMPYMNPVGTNSGFNIFLDAVLNYDSLNSILNDNISGRQFDIDKGPVKKKFKIKRCTLIGAGNEKIIVKTEFDGDEEGVAYLVGKPFYEELTKTFVIRNLDFDIKSKDALLKVADWLFSRKIINEISKHTQFDLSQYIDTAKKIMNVQLNKEWMPGIRSEGMVNDLKLTGIYPLEKHLIIRSNCSGYLSVKVETIPLTF